MRRHSIFEVTAPIILALCLSAASGSCRAGEQDSTFAKARQEMVRTQIAARGITNKRVLAAMEKVERHRFVPPGLESEAYNDYPLPIGEGQTISQPYIVALMTDLLNLNGRQKVLEIGTGSGYQAAILGELAGEVFTIEIIDTLARTAEQRLKSLGYANIIVRSGDGYLGWPEKAPFDAIIVTCAPDSIPQPLLDQLAEGGRMVIPVGSAYQNLILIEKKGGQLKKSTVAPVRFVPMTRKEPKK